MNRFTRLVQIGLMLLFVCHVSANYAFAAVGFSYENATSEFQSVPIKGTITDKSGEPVIGATVVIAGTSTGSTSGVDGGFSFNASEGSVVNVAFLGYKDASFTVVKGQSVYNVVLEDDALVAEEVIVTALGIKRSQKAIGYAVSEIKGEDIAAVNVASPVTALQGKAAGVSIRQSSGGVAGGTSIKIRGLSTLKVSQPIFVVDGVILENTMTNKGETNTNDYGNQLKNLNADDFESMTVLKGAAATALYGSRGINGAVVITTKSGKSGRNFGVSFSQVTGVDVVYNTPKFQNEFGNGAYPGDINYTNRPDGTMNMWDNTTPYYEKIDGQYIPSLRFNSLDKTAFGARVSDVRKLNGGKIVDFDGELVDYRLYPNNLKDTYDVGVNTSTNVAISGGSEKMTFYLSDTYQYRKGTFPDNTLERNSLLLKATYKISDKLSVDASISYANSSVTNPPYAISEVFWDGNIGRDYNVNKYKDLWRTDHGGMPNSNYGDKYGAVPAMDFWFKLNTKDNLQKENMITPIVRLNYKVTDWLSVVAEGNMNLLMIETENKELGNGYRMEGGSYGIGQRQDNQRSAKVTANFNKKFGDFTTSLIVGGDWYRQRRVATSSWTKGGLIVPGQFFIKNSKNPVESEANYSNSKNISSVFFMASVSWKDQLFLDITGRNDWSTALVYSNGTGNNSYFYPSVSGSWLFSESFNVPDWFTFGKLRASWAQVGNDTEPYFINNSYKVTSSELLGGMQYGSEFSKRLVDPSLRPERKNSIEFGLDVRFLDSRIGLDLTYYKDNTRDQIVELPASGESGVDKQLVNAGNIQNQGIEIALNTTPIRKKNFEWDLNFIYFKNNNTIKSLHPDMGKYKEFNNDPNGGTKLVGYIGGNYGDVLTSCLPKTNEAGEKILVWNDGYRGAYYPRSGTEVKIGDINPSFEGSMYNSFRFHGVEIGILIDTRIGGYMETYAGRYLQRNGFAETSLYGRSPEYGGMEFTSKYASSAGINYTDGVLPEGVFAENTIVTTPEGNRQDVSGMSYKKAYESGYIEPTHAGYYNYRIGSWSTGWVDDSWIQKELKYIALRNVSIGYTLPAKAVKKLRISNLHISLDGHNLCYLYNNMPNKIHPESAGDSPLGVNASALTAYTATYSLAIRFNL